MLAWSGIILFISLQLISILSPTSKPPIYQTGEESAKIASKDVLAEKAEPSPALTLTPTPTPTSTPTPTPSANTNTPASNQNFQSLSPTPTTVLPAAQENWQSFMMGQVNSFRASKGLPSVSTNSETCSFAKTRLSEIGASLSHDGFRQRLDSNTMPYPGFSSVAENLAMHYDFQQVVPGWINSPGHNDNLSKDTPFACIERQGDYFVYEAWRP